MDTPLGVLIVEDDAHLADVLCQRVDRIMPTASCEIAGHLHQALAMIAARPTPYAVAVVDLSLPDTRQQSLDAIYAIFQAAPTLPIIVCTGVPQWQEVQQYGVRTWLVKGLHLGELLETALREACPHGCI